VARLHVLTLKNVGMCPTHALYNPCVASGLC
jgi:hypothetical protein